MCAGACTGMGLMVYASDSARVYAYMFRALGCVRVYVYTYTCMNVHVWQDINVLSGYEHKYIRMGACVYMTCSSFSRRWIILRSRIH